MPSGRLLHSLAVAFLACVSCARNDPSRVQAFEARLDEIDRLPRVAGGLSGFALPRVPAAGAKAIDAERLATIAYGGGKILVGGRWRTGEEAIEAIEELAVLESADSVVHVAAVDRELPAAPLQDLLREVDGRIELRLLVGIEGTAPPLPEGLSAESRARLERLPGAFAFERVEALDALAMASARRCAPLRQALRSSTDRAAIVAAVRSCGSGRVDLPTLEAAYGTVLGAYLPRLASVPFDEVVNVATVQDLASAAARREGSSIVAEPGLGSRCAVDADCASPEARCLPFDRNGRHDRTGELACTRACGAGCPDGFTCADGFCGPRRPRLKPLSPSEIPRDVVLRYLAGNLSFFGNRPTLWYDDECRLVVAASRQVQRFLRREDAIEALRELVAFDPLRGPRSERLQALIPLTPESVEAAPYGIGERERRALGAMDPADAYRRMSPAGGRTGVGPVLYWEANAAVLLGARERRDLALDTAIDSFVRETPPRCGSRKRDL